MDVSTAITVAELHNANGGASYSLDRGNLAGQPGYALSVFPEHSLILPRKFINPRDVLGYYNSHKDLLSNSVNAFGTWFNADKGQTYIDISTVLTDRELAVRAARRANQIAVFNLATYEEIPTGGTGEAINGLPSGAARLLYLFS